MPSSSTTSKAASAWEEMEAEESKKREHNAARVKVGFVNGKECLSSKDKAKKVSKKKAVQDKKDRFFGSKASVVNSILSSNKGALHEELPATTEAGPARIIPLAADGSTPVPEHEEELVAKLQRSIQQTGDASVSVRKNALQALHDLFVVHLSPQEVKGAGDNQDDGDREDDKGDVDADKMIATTESGVKTAAAAALPPGHVSACLEELSKPLLKRFGDNSEKCRQLSIQLVAWFVRECKNLVGLMPYLWPAVLRKLAPGHAYDQESCIFVHDVESHEAWKRGAATARQDMADRGAGGDASAHTVVEPSEEVRLSLLSLVGSLLHGMLGRGTTTLLHPYFHDAILFLQAHLRDPMPEVKVLACKLLVTMARHTAWNQGMILYALAIGRAGLPLLRHRHARVRAEAVKLVRAAICVPYKAKCRGAGTDCVVDLIGYTSEDTIPIAAFYGRHTQVNYLAELSIDSVSSVRLEVSKMLHEMLTTLPDRYDHRTRIIAYVLNCVNDADPKVSAVAMEGLAIAGAEYERENEKEVVERRQYGVDGDRRAFHDNDNGDLSSASRRRPLPYPFGGGSGSCSGVGGVSSSEAAAAVSGRPRLGTRLYVRGCTRRFLKPLLQELTNWNASARLASAKLLRTVVVYCEESLTEQLHALLPLLAHAFKVFNSEGVQTSGEVADVLAEVCELLGRFIAPDSFVPFLLPRLRGELEVVPNGTDGLSRALVLQVAGCMLRGCKASEVVKHCPELVDAITDEEVVLGSTLPLLRVNAFNCLRVVIEAMAESANNTSTAKAKSAAFLATGRLAPANPSSPSSSSGAAAVTSSTVVSEAAHALLVWKRSSSRSSSSHALLNSGLAPSEKSSSTATAAVEAAAMTRGEIDECLATLATVEVAKANEATDWQQDQEKQLAGGRRAGKDKDRDGPRLLSVGTGASSKEGKRLNHLVALRQGLRSSSSSKTAAAASGGGGASVSGGSGGGSRHGPQQLWLVEHSLGSWLVGRHAKALAHKASTVYPLDAFWEEDSSPHALLAELLDTLPFSLAAAPLSPSEGQRHVDGKIVAVSAAAAAAAVVSPSEAVLKQVHSLLFEDGGGEDALRCAEMELGGGSEEGSSLLRACWLESLTDFMRRLLLTAQKLQLQDGGSGECSSSTAEAFSDAFADSAVAPLLVALVTKLVDLPSSSCSKDKSSSSSSSSSSASSTTKAAKAAEEAMTAAVAAMKARQIKAKEECVAALFALTSFSPPPIIRNTATTPSSSSSGGGGGHDCTLPNVLISTAARMFASKLTVQTTQTLSPRQTMQQAHSVVTERERLVAVGCLHALLEVGAAETLRHQASRADKSNSGASRRRPARLRSFQDMGGFGRGQRASTCGSSSSVAGGSGVGAPSSKALPMSPLTTLAPASLSSSVSSLSSWFTAARIAYEALRGCLESDPSEAVRCAAAGVMGGGLLFFVAPLPSPKPPPPGPLLPLTSNDSGSSDDDLEWEKVESPTAAAAKAMAQKNTERSAVETAPDDSDNDADWISLEHLLDTTLSICVSNATATSIGDPNGADPSPLDTDGDKHGGAGAVAAVGTAPDYWASVAAAEKKQCGQERNRFLDHVEALLRAAAVIEPLTFQAAVARSASAAVSAAAAGGGIGAAPPQVLVDLKDHGDLLVSFALAKSSKNTSSPPSASLSSLLLPPSPPPASFSTDTTETVPAMVAAGLAAVAAAAAEDDSEADSDDEGDGAGDVQKGINHGNGSSVLYDGLTNLDSLD